MKLIIDIPETQYNIMDLKILCLGRIPYKGIIRHSIIAIQNGIPLKDEVMLATLMSLVTDKDYKPKLEGESK